MFPAPPPGVPDGWTCAPPDFVGVGAQKAGTSWWHECLTAHPRVHRVPGSAKEVHFFDEYWRKPFRPEDRDAYQRHFPRGVGGIAGEWTPRYMVDHWTLPLLWEAAPRARVLVMLRDPIERYRSGVIQETYGNAFIVPYDYPNAASISAARGLYHHQLAAILRHFPREQLLLIQYERALLTPEQELRRTWEFLGLEHEPTVAAATVGQRVNVTTRTKPALEPSLRQGLLDSYADDLALLLRDFGDEIDGSLWATCVDLGLA